MPVIVIGADTAHGRAIMPALEPQSGEIRVFVSDPEFGEQLRPKAKVAVGDVSDGSHVGGAAIGAFCAITIATAAADNRERSFAPTPEAVYAQWADGLSDAGIGRIIFVGTRADLELAAALRKAAPDFVFVDSAATTDIAAEVARREQAQKISGHQGAG
ncbi:MAG: hypothetical protein QNJ77_05740 [Acidimicrobiia bacterium]|nr:hypothetical protein [Acidimicrobiia bacterium]